MANAILIYNKKGKVNNENVERASLTCLNVLPDNMEKKPIINIKNNVLIGLTYFNEAIKMTDNGLLLGNVFRKYENIWDSQSTTPDGSFSIFRWDEYSIELLSDIGATRTIWYYSDEDYFIVSTSQRMIVTFLGSYQPNADVFPWMMSTGSLGPYMSWDKRINFLPPDSKLHFNRKSHEMNLIRNQCVFKEKNLNKKRHKDELKNSLQQSFDQLNYDFNNHYMALSGGYDSRGILLFLKGKRGINTITWGEYNGESVKLSDASVARRLAEHFKTNHYYLDINNQEQQSTNKILERFIKNGEGRTDNLSGYIDGFKLWKELKDHGVQGLIRGDENFGMVDVLSQQNVIDMTGLSTLKEYQNIPSWFKEIYSNQQIPKELKQRHHESLEQWRDRLHQEYRTPVYLAALTTLKNNYVEISNPLLSKLIINKVRTLPDSLRNNKTLFKKIVNSKSPNIPYASHSSTANLNKYLKRNSVVNIFEGMFRKNEGKYVPKSVTDFLLDNIEEQQAEQSIVSVKARFRNKIKGYMPQSIKNVLKKNMKKKIDYNLLAFRVYIILRMQEILNEDANKIYSMDK